MVRLRELVGPVEGRGDGRMWRVVEPRARGGGRRIASLCQTGYEAWRWCDIYIVIRRLIRGRRGEDVEVVILVVVVTGGAMFCYAAVG